MNPDRRSKTGQISLWLSEKIGLVQTETLRLFRDTIPVVLHLRVNGKKRIENHKGLFA